MALTARDRDATKYSMSALKEGDTLIFIKFPNNKPVYDATGFQISTHHRVHSEKLRATGSTWFIRHLDDQWLNHRAAKKAGVLNNYPEGVVYVIDMTPPDEGDEALDLVADLSCSPGVLNWRKSSRRLGVPYRLVGGKDETDMQHIVSSLPPSPTKAVTSAALPSAVTQPPVSELSTAVSAVLNGEASGSSFSGVVPDQSAHEITSRTTQYDFDTQRPNLVSDSGETLSNARFEVIGHDEEESLDYCPIRHRTCTERLLQIIEGKNPRLDSAPKVWNVAVLAAAYDCRSTVENYIISWILDGQNARFIEILPEAALKMSYKLQTPHLARWAYAILVSEEALRVGHGKSFKEDPAKSPEEKITRLGRVREDLDEDTVNSIQHAGRNLFDRVDELMGDLIEPSMAWLQESVPEYQRLAAFFTSIDASSTLGNKQYIQTVSSDLMKDLQHYVRGRVFFRLLLTLPPHLSSNATARRRDENWNGDYDGEFGSLYNMLADKERFMIRPFWELFQGMNWDMQLASSRGDGQTNNALDNLSPNNAYHSRGQAIFEWHKIEPVSLYHLRDLADTLNKAAAPRNNTSGVGEASRTGIAPPTGSPNSVNRLTDRLAQMNTSPVGATLAAHDGSAIHGTQDQITPSARDILRGTTSRFSASGLSHIVEAFADTSAVFSLPKFMEQVGQHIQAICDRMLDKGECGNVSNLCDTLLCLSEDEYKYLPLWAGGMDDGSGGVFAEAIPPALRGPMGPGPAFHTGSTANSVVSSDFEHIESSAFSSTMDGVETSLGVEDGFSDHVDRRLVVSENDFPMDHGALPSRPPAQPSADAALGRIFVDGIQGGRNDATHAVEASVEQTTPTAAATSSESFHFDELFTSQSDEGEDMDFMNDDEDVDDEGDMNDEESTSEGTLTDTEWEDVTLH